MKVTVYDPQGWLEKARREDWEGKIRNSLSRFHGSLDEVALVFHGPSELGSGRGFTLSARLPQGGALVVKDRGKRLSSCLGRALTRLERTVSRKLGEPRPRFSAAPVEGLYPDWTAGHVPRWRLGG